jgi:hypothetical protein
MIVDGVMPCRSFVRGESLATYVPASLHRLLSALPLEILAVCATPAAICRICKIVTVSHSLVCAEWRAWGNASMNRSRNLFVRCGLENYGKSMGLLVACLARQSHWTHRPRNKRLDVPEGAAGSACEVLLEMDFQREPTWTQ